MMMASPSSSSSSNHTNEQQRQHAHNTEFMLKRLLEEMGKKQQQTRNNASAAASVGHEPALAAAGPPDMRSTSSAALVADMLRSGSSLNSTLLRDTSGASAASFFKSSDVFKSGDVFSVGPFLKSQDSMVQQLLQSSDSVETIPPLPNTQSAQSTTVLLQLPDILSSASSIVKNSGGPATRCTSQAASNVFASRDWVSDFAESHEDIDPQKVFQSETSNDKKPPAAATTAVAVGQESTLPTTTKKSQLASWEADFFGSLPSRVSAKVTATNSNSGILKKDSTDDNVPDLVDANEAKPAAAGRPAAPVLPSKRPAPSSCPPQAKAETQDQLIELPAVAATQTQQKKSGRNTDDGERVYHKPKDVDVLMGRGGRTNHHPGNKMYLAAKEDIQPRYLAASKNEKTDIANELVARVHAWQGRFLQHDENLDQWFEVTAKKARKKASQTLREINTPEQRAAKRAKYGK